MQSNVTSEVKERVGISVASDKIVWQRTSWRILGRQYARETISVRAEDSVT